MGSTRALDVLSLAQWIIILLQLSVVLVQAIDGGMNMTEESSGENPDMLVPDCIEERVGLFLWPVTQPGQNSSQPCYINSTITNVTATRQCSMNGTWLEPSITDCTRAIPRLRLSPPPLIELEPEGPFQLSGRYEVNDGSSFFLQCIADLYPVESMEWIETIDEQVVSTSNTGNSVNLSLPRVTFIDSRIYSCRANTLFNSTTTSIMISVVLLCPEEQDLNGNLTWPVTRLGQTVMQPCFPNVPSINFTATRTCTVGDGDARWLPANTSECSQAVPQLRLVPDGQQYNVKIQTPFSLQCIAEGYPVTKSIRWIRWIQGGQTELIEPTINNTATLSTQNITLDDAGVYNCVADTPYTSVNIIAIINVITNCPPEQNGPIVWKSTKPGTTVVVPCFERYIFTTVNKARRLCLNTGIWAPPDYTQCRRVQPRIRLRPRSPNNQYTVLTNSGFSLNCFAELFPIQSIGWFRVQGTNFVRVRTSSSSPLSLRIFNTRDTGVYVCAANTRFTLPEDVPVFVTANITVIAGCPRRSTFKIEKFSGEEVAFRWPATRPGETVSLPCFPDTDFTLQATRVCHQNRTWSEVDFSSCESAVPELTLTAPDVIEQGRLMNLSCAARPEYIPAAIGLADVSTDIPMLLVLKRGSYANTSHLSSLNSTLTIMCFAQHPYASTNITAVVRVIAANTTSPFQVSLRFAVSLLSSFFFRTDRPPPPPLQPGDPGPSFPGEDNPGAPFPDRVEGDQAPPSPPPPVTIPGVRDIIFYRPITTIEIIEAKVLELLPVSENGVQNVSCIEQLFCPIFQYYVLQDYQFGMRVLCTVSSYPTVNDTANISLRRLTRLLDPLNETLHESPPDLFSAVANFKYEELPKPMVTMGDNRNQTVIIGDTFNIEIQRRSRLRCTSNMGSFNPRNDNIFRTSTRDIPVFTSWLVWDEIQTEDLNIPESFLRCNGQQPRRRRNIEQPPVGNPVEFIVVTGEERSVNITCAAVGEFGTTTQVVMINVIGPSGVPSTFTARFLIPVIDIPLPVRQQQITPQDINTRSTDNNELPQNVLFNLEQRVLGIAPESGPGVQTVKCSGTRIYIGDGFSQEANCSISSYNTTDQEFAQLVANVNATLHNNSLPNVDIFEGSVIVAVGGFCPEEILNSQLYGTYNWIRTGGNNTAVLPCFLGRVQDGEPGGLAVRRCQAGGSWNTPDFRQCRDTLPYLTINVFRPSQTQLGSSTVIVEQGRAINIGCSYQSVFFDEELTTWFQIVNGEEVRVPDSISFFDNFIDSRNPNDSSRQNLQSRNTQKALRPNVMLEDTMRLYSNPGFALDLIFPTLQNIGEFKSSSTIGGVYICRATNRFGTRAAIVNITVKVPEGDSSAVYIRFTTNLNNLEYVGQNLSLAFVENRLLDYINSSIGQQTVDCSVVPMIVLGSQQDEEDYPDRIECVIRQFGAALPDGGLLAVGEKLPMILSPLLEQDGPSSIGLLQGSERTSVTGFCSYEKTSSEQFGSYNWPETVGKEVIEFPCTFRPNYLARRTCSQGGSWVAVDFSNCRISVPQAGYTMFVRFSSQLNNVLESGDLDGAIENIENVVINITNVTCEQVAQRVEDEALNRSRVECVVVGPMTSQQEQAIVQREIEQQISSLLRKESFSIVGTEVDTDGGFCNAETLDGGRRGVFRWNETVVGNTVTTSCFYGPPEVIVARTCVSRQNLTAPSIENCRTFISNEYITLDNDNVTDITLRNLSFTVNRTTELPDQNTDNIAVVRNIFRETLVLAQTVPVLPETLENAITILDDIEEWPADVIDEETNQIVRSFEAIARGLLQQENFTNITVIREDIAFIGELLQREEFTGRLFSSSFEGGLNVTTRDAPTERTGLAEDQAASITLPREIVNDIPDNSDEVRIAFTSFRGAELFPVRDVPVQDGRDVVVGSSVISAIVNGIRDGTQLSAPVEVLLLLTNLPEIGPNDTIISRTCAFWDFNGAGGNGNWSTVGCNTTYNESTNVATCVCNHLTNFAVLVDISARIGDRQPVQASFALALDITSYIGIVLSFLGLILLILTHLIFKKLRDRDVSKFHIQLALSLLLMLLVFVAGIDQTHNIAGCVTVGMFLHYSLLVTWMWMAAEALLLFQKLVIVFIKVSVKYLVIVSFVCWGVPLVPVIITAAVNTDNYVTHSNNITGAPGYCFISNVGAFFGGFLGLIFLIMLFNAVIFISVIVILTRHHIKRHKQQMKNSKTKLPPKDACKLIISLTGIMSLLGLTWILALFTFVGVSHNHDAAFGLQWLFVFFNSLQGFFLFIFFVILSSDARNLWLGVVCKKRKTTEPSTSKTKLKTAGSSATAKSNSTVSNDYSSLTLENRGTKLTKGLSQDAIYEDIEGEENSSELDVVEMTIDESMSEYATLEGYPKDEFYTHYEKGLPAEAKVTRSLTIRETHLIEKAELNFGNDSVEQADSKM